MTNEQIKLLIKIKELVYKGKRHFKSRNDRNYLDDLANLGLTVEEAWNHVLSLNANFYFVDPKPNYSQNKESLTFKKSINGKTAYIK